jgi:thymidylate synthase
MDHPEHKYLNIIQKILTQGTHRDDRTGVGTISLFGEYMKIDVSETYPLLTTKRVFFRGVVEELLWMLRGETDASILEAKNINIWNGNSTDPKYLERTGNTPYDIGPGYGFQLRHFGGDYTDIKSDGGVDQLRYVLNEIQTNPTSRRIMWSYWNPKQMKDMCLPPCHYSYQFYIADSTISCLMTQRSADFFLGVPFNIASVALMTYIIAHVFHLKPGSINVSMGDVHLYSTHIEQAKLQNSRNPYPFPTLSVLKDIPLVTTVDEKLKFIETLRYDDFRLQDYRYHPSIKAPMAV